MLRVCTAGSVDDGKSTLLAQLQLQLGTIPDDQLAALRSASQRWGCAEVELGLLSDGLRVEREQKITIDVGYRRLRDMILADAPGHPDYTRNMLCAAAGADVMILLLDVQKGVTPQTRRHALLASFVAVPELVVAVNKMDLVDYSRSRFEEVCAEFRSYAERLQLAGGLHFVPVSARSGENVAARSARTPWYDGPSLLHHLETARRVRNLVDFRFPVQCVLRPDAHFRGFAGRIASGHIAVSDEVVVLPSGSVSRVRRIWENGLQVERAEAGQSVLLVLEHEVDVARGDWIVRRKNLPHSSADVDAMLCWLGEAPLEEGSRLLWQGGTLRCECLVERIDYRLDPDSLHRDSRLPQLVCHEVGRVQLRISRPVFFDEFAKNRATGCFILIDPRTCNTVAAGTVRGESPELPRSRNVREEPSLVGSGERQARAGHLPFVVWLTGLSGAGKSTLARQLEKRWFDAGRQVVWLDGDNLRGGLNSDLRFGAQDRLENVRRVAEAARLFYQNGFVVICSLISPDPAGRALARSRFPEGRFFEVYVRCSLEVCRQRDPKGLYERAARGEVKQFTGISQLYSEPESPELVLDSVRLPAELLVEQLEQAVQGMWL